MEHSYQKALDYISKQSQATQTSLKDLLLEIAAVQDPDEVAQRIRNHMLFTHPKMVDELPHFQDWNWPRARAYNLFFLLMILLVGAAIATAFSQQFLIASTILVPTFMLHNILRARLMDFYDLEKPWESEGKVFTFFGALTFGAGLGLGFSLNMPLLSIPIGLAACGLSIFLPVFYERRLRYFKPKTQRENWELYRMKVSDLLRSFDSNYELTRKIVNSRLDREFRLPI